MWVHGYSNTVLLKLNYGKGGEINMKQKYVKIVLRQWQMNGVIFLLKCGVSHYIVNEL
jgi:hypothetical protein